MRLLRSVKKPVWISALVLVLTMAVAGSAFAFSNSFSGSISPGARVCLAPQYATSYADAQGTASPYAKFIVLWGPTPDTASTQIYATTDTTAGFHATFDRNYFPSYFPGYFKLCARNNGTTTVKVNMGITGY